MLIACGEVVVLITNYGLIISHDYQCQVLIEVALVSVVREVRIVYVYKYENKIPVPD